MSRFILLVILGFCFAAAPARAADDLLDIYKPYEADTQVPLTQAHRSLTELSEWLSDTVSNALVFTRGQNAKKLETLRSLFTESGYAAYINFLTAYDLNKDIAEEGLGLSSVVNTAPALIGQGANSTRYAWAFELPVVMTIAGTEGGQPISKKVTLRIQVGRAEAAPAPHQLLIENWQEYKPVPQTTSQNTSGQPEQVP
jgi:hypothetical protein